MEQEITFTVKPFSEIKIGSHITKLPSFNETVNRIPLLVYQIYLSSPKAFYKANSINETDILKFRARNFNVFIHGSLLYNLSGSAKSNDPELEIKRKKTVQSLILELDMAVLLNAKGVVCHFGSCDNYELGFQKMITSINECLTQDSNKTEYFAKLLNITKDEFKSKRNLIMENMVGGNRYGKTIQEIAKVCNLCSIQVCIDTAHIFGAGQYHFGHIDEIDRFYKEFDNSIGLKKLALFHLNDSKVPFDSGKDRHENLTLGYIFKDEPYSLIYLLNKFDVPFISETPSHLFDRKIIQELINAI